jgi:hypothetical protein
LPSPDLLPLPLARDFFAVIPGVCAGASADVVLLALEGVGLVHDGGFCDGTMIGDTLNVVGGLRFVTDSQQVLKGWHDARSLAAEVHPGLAGPQTAIQHH